MAQDEPPVTHVAVAGGAPIGATVVCDTRQQAGKHANVDGWFDAHGVAYVYRKLDFGDYAVDGSNVVVDTKRSVAEVAQNVGRDHARLVREIERAGAAGCRLVFLVEVGWPYREVEDVARWTAVPCRRCEHRRMGECDPRFSDRCARYRHKPMQGPTVARIMRSMERDHGCRFEMCRPSETAARICELLGVSHA